MSRRQQQRQRRIERMRRVEREFLAACSATQLLDERLRSDPSWGHDFGWRAQDAALFAANIEATFIIRLFAEFDAGLRDAWKSYFERKTQPRMRDLLLAVAAKQRIPHDWLAAADLVRKSRNATVHAAEDAGDRPALSLAEANRFLCRYFSILPPDW